jgi:hypothetical protein
MSRRFENVDELRALLDALCEESITAEQMQRLEELVLNHPEAEAYYVQYLSLHADLAGHFGVLPAKMEQSLRDRLETAGQGDAAASMVSRPGDDRTPAAGPQSGPYGISGRPKHGTRSPFLIWGTLGLSGLAAGLLLYVALLPTPHDLPPFSNPRAEAMDNTVAVLLQAPGAIWEQTELPTRAGAPLPPGTLRLKSGSVQIEFYNGAVVILEGPAEFRLISRTEAYCARGKLRASVPPQAQGFTIGSPKLDLVDRGTEFGLDVGAAGKTEVHVFQGKVELYGPGPDRKALGHKELTTGQSVRLEDPGKVQPIKSNPAAFMTAQDLAERSQEQTRLRQKEWRETSEALRKDPSLLVYYTFQADQPWSRTLLDQAGGRKQPKDGAVVGCTWGPGRWPGKDGLEFKRVSDRVRLHVPGEFDSITLMAWVRVDSLPNRNNSLMMSEGWEEGEMHWQIGDNGMVILGLQSSPKGRGAHYHAYEVLTPERFGQWIHLALVYDRENELVSQYVDGRRVVQQPIEFDIPLRIGDAELGNWNVATHRNSTPVRNLNGCMDEFMLFSRALSEQEIEQLYSRGRPPM